MSGANGIGSEILVNTTTLSSQEAPVITGLANGGFVVTWADYSETGGDASGATMRAQVFDAGGGKVGGEILVPTSVAGPQNMGAIATLTDGRFVVTWQDGSRSPDDNSGTAVRAQIFNADGSRSGFEFLVPAATLGHQGDPAIATLSGGRFVAAWTDSGATGETDISAQIFNANGTRSGAEFLVNTTTLNHQNSPAITALPNDHFVVAWTDESMTGGDLSGAAIRAQVFASDGTRLGNELLVNTTTTSVQFEPAITGLSDGRFVVSWTDLSQTGGDQSQYAVRAQVFNGDGTRSGAEFLVNTTTAAIQEQPSLAALPGGQFVAVWADGSGDTITSFGVRAQLFGGDGSKIGAELFANTTAPGAQWRPTVAALANGSFAVAWEDKSATGGDTSSNAIRAQIFQIGEAPVITSGGGGDSATFAVSEGTNAVTTVAAVDADSPAPTYSIVGGADAARFQIDGATGALSFVAAPSFEAPTDADHDNAYQVTVRASDGALYDQQAITVHVTDVNEAPVITSNGGVATAIIYAPEGTSAVTTVTASDPDAGSTLHFSLAGGPDAALFQIDATTGALSLNHVPDFETPIDAGHIDSYKVFVRASDGTLSSDQLVIFRVTDVNEAPVITSNGGVATAIIYAPEGTSAVTTVTASDPDAGSTLHFSLAGGPDAALFQIDATTGALSLNHVPDFETPIDAGHIDSYKVFVRASDGALSSDQLVIFRVTDVNEAPAITSDGGGPNASVTIAENSTAVTTVTASDPDAGTVLHYSIVGGDDAALFQIDEASGALSFVTAPDYEAAADSDHAPDYAVQVQVSDGILTDTQTLTVNITDERAQPEMVWLTGTQGDDTFAALPGAERIDALNGNDTVSFDFKLTDAVVTYTGNQVIVDGPSSHTILTGFERFVFTDGTVDNADRDRLVDDLFYYSHNHDVWESHADADAHYHTFGWHEQRDPSAFFSTATYLSLYQDVNAANVDPLLHFESSGWREVRLPSFAFDDAAYLNANPDVAAAGHDPLEHFLTFGAQEGRLPFAVSARYAANTFDYVYYLQHNPDVAAAGIDPWRHFNDYGWREGRNPNAFFDTRGYLETYTDVAAAGFNPLDHYHVWGWTEGRDPSTIFDTAGYLSQNPDVVAAHMDPLLHFLCFGQAEGRTAVADGHWG